MPPPSVKSRPTLVDPAATATKRQRYVQAFVAVVLVGIVVIWFSSRSSGQLNAVRTMQRELFATPPGTMKPEERKEKFEALRAEQEKLSEAERKELRKETFEHFIAKRNAEAVAYMKMPPAERLKIIDQKIAREQAFQKKAPAAGTAPPGGGQVVAANGGASNGGGPSGGAAVNAAPAPVNAPGAAVKNGPPKGVPLSAEDRDGKRREMLIHSTAEARAGMDQMRLDMALRRAQKGLPAVPIPPPGRGPR